MGDWTQTQREALRVRALDPDWAAGYGIQPVKNLIAARALGRVPKSWTNGFPGLAIPWTSPVTSETAYQLRPDSPSLDEDGRPRKYLFPEGWVPRLHQARTGEEKGTVLLVEGSLQTAAATRYAPPEWGVYGLAGCRAWMHDGAPIPDLDCLADRNVVVVFDADVESNPEVWNAGQQLSRTLALLGAKTVKFALSGWGGKAGLDDVLGKQADERRTPFLERLVGLAVAKPKKPTRAEARSRLVQTGLNNDAERAKREKRPLIDLSGDRLEVHRQLQAALAAKNPDTFYSRGGTLVERRGPRLTVVSKERIASAIVNSARIGRLDANPLMPDSAWMDQDAPMSSINALIGHWDHWPELVSVTETPFVRPDGTLCLESGYDKATKTYLASSVKGVQVPDHPTQQDTAQAMSLLVDQWLRDFPFEGEADRTMALALVLTPFVRNLFGTTPLFVVDGNRMSTGKGKLIGAVGLLAKGHPQGLTPMPDDSEELRKQVTSKFLAGETIFAWDEVVSVRGRILAQLLTGPVWDDRMLGSSRMASVPNRATFMAAGNSVTIGGDLSRRVTRIRLYSDDERPQDRDARQFFAQPSLEVWTQNHREQLLSAVFTLVRAWYQAGCPYTGEHSFGSFEEWQRVVGGILEHGGRVLDLDPTKAWATESDSDQDIWLWHLQWLQDTYGVGTSFRANDVIARLSTDRDPAVPLIEPYGSRLGRLDPSDPRCSKALGELYKRYGSRWDGGLGLRSHRGHNNTTVWTLQSREEEDIQEVIIDPKLITPRIQKTPEMGELGELGEPLPRLPKRDAFVGPEETPETIVRVSSGGGVSYSPGSPGSPIPPTGVPSGLWGEPDEQLLPSNPAVALLRSLVPPDRSLCPECGSEETLVDGLWWACSACYPETAKRGTPWK